MVLCDEEIQHLRQISRFESYHVVSDIPISGKSSVPCRVPASWPCQSKSKTIQLPSVHQTVPGHGLGSVKCGKIGNGISEGVRVVGVDSRVGQGSGAKSGITG